MKAHPFPAPRPPARVAVAMSGGVDSSVAAALLVEQGHAVVGVHMKLHDLPDAQRKDKSCCSLDDALDARQACAKLGIPFYVLDFTTRFQEEVIDYFVTSYRRGLTPNPCVMCNMRVKNTVLLKRVRDFGCDYLATGHYARVGRHPDTGEAVLARPADRLKDQTYFLFGTPRAELPSLLFPLADLEKPAARAIAERRGFFTWNKPDSQEVCFIPRDLPSFWEAREEHRHSPPGDFVDTAGRMLGRHRGLPFYTVGQRRGLGISAPQPLYVVALRPECNQVVLGKEEDLDARTLRVAGVNWVSCPPITGPIEADVKIRYAHPGARARIYPEEGAVQGEAVRVEFMAPVRAATPGQAAVFYQGDIVLGGGWILPEPV